jgi:hypothetical protein
MIFPAQIKRVGLLENSTSDRYGHLFETLGQLYPIEFRRVPSDGLDGVDALIVLDGNIAAGLATAADGLPVLVVMMESDNQSVNGSQPVRFGEAQDLEPCLRNQVMVEKDGSGGCSIANEPGDQVLASRGKSAVWVNRPRGLGSCLFAGVPLPSLGEDEYLFDYWNGRRFMGLLPLMHFLRQVVKDADWKSPAPRACFVFDDPSLYWRSYGFLDYRALAAHSVKHNYFASVATIPLDAWWVNGRVAETLRSSHPRLSLLIHGNNHTYKELVSQRNGTTPLAIAAQSLQRLEGLERRHGVSVSRIMEAPHGAIGKSFFAPLLALNYEAALTSSELLVKHNPQTAWAAGVGMDMSEMLGGGLPVLPRIKMSADWKNEVLLAAFLGQPILLAGHHQDAADQLQLLADFARVVNCLPAATWASPQDIVRSNYKEFRSGGTLFLKLYSRAVHVVAPEGVNEIFINRPWVGQESAGETLVIKSRGGELLRATGPEVVGPISVSAGQSLDISSLPVNQVDFRSVKSSGAICWPVARKVMMEIRDRIAPLRRRARKTFRAGTAN